MGDDPVALCFLTRLTPLNLAPALRSALATDPGSVPAVLAELGRQVGGFDLVVYLIDFGQLVTAARDGGFRVWVPVIEGSDHTGVLAVTMADTEPEALIA